MTFRLGLMSIVRNKSRFIFFKGKNFVFLMKRSVDIISVICSNFLFLLEDQLVVHLSKNDDNDVQLGEYRVVITFFFPFGLLEITLRTFM